VEEELYDAVVTVVDSIVLLFPRGLFKTIGIDGHVMWHILFGLFVEAKQRSFKLAATRRLTSRRQRPYQPMRKDTKVCH